MDNAIQIFNNPEFGQVRTITHNGEIWFVGKDVVSALGYTDLTHAVLDHVDEEDRINSKTQGQNNPEFGQRGAWLINESGLYSLVLSSKLSTAKKFKRWVTSEVLPSIRKNGFYGFATKEEYERSIARAVGIEMRKGMTDAIKEVLPETKHKKFAYPNYTNLVYKIIFGKNTKQLKFERELPQDANIREYLTSEELTKVEMVEGLVKTYLYAGLEYEQIKNVLRATFPDGVKLVCQITNNRKIA